jgi:hypothetical protein
VRAQKFCEKPHGAFETDESVFATDGFLLMSPYQAGQLYLQHEPV